jgi:hypothetical protein
MPDYGRLIPGQFKVQRVDANGEVYEETTPWLEYREHYHGGIRKGIICSAGPHYQDRKKRYPCLGCELYWEDWEIRRNMANSMNVKMSTIASPKRVSARDMYVFLWLDMGYFFKTEGTDANGNIKVDPGTGKPYMNWVKFTNDAQRHQMQGRDGRYGMIYPWPVGRDYFSIITTHSDMVAKNCMSCGGANTIYAQRWECPQCSTVLLDARTAGLREDQLKEITGKPNTCRSCGLTTYPKEVVGCLSCQQPRSVTIFDVNLNVLAPKDYKGKTQLMIPNVSAPCGIDVHFHDLLKKLPAVEKKFAPTPYTEQAAIFQHSMQAPLQQPPMGPPAQPYAQTYGQPYAPATPQAPFAGAPMMEQPPHGWPPPGSHS